MRMENSKGAEKGVSCRSGPHEWDDACGNLKPYIYVTNLQFTHSNESCSNTVSRPLKEFNNEETWAKLTALSAVHILTWSPELGLTLLVAKLNWGNVLDTPPDFVTCLKPEQVRARTLNMALTQITSGKYIKLAFNTVLEVLRSLKHMNQVLFFLLITNINLFGCRYHFSECRKLLPRCSKIKLPELLGKLNGLLRENINQVILIRKRD